MPRQKQQQLFPFPDPNATGDTPPDPETELKVFPRACKSCKRVLGVDEAEAVFLHALGSMTSADARNRRQFLLAEKSYGVILTAHGQVEGQPVTLQANGYLCAQADGEERRGPDQKSVLAVILAHLGPAKREALFSLVQTQFDKGNEIPEELLKMADDLLKRLKKPKPKRGAVKWTGTTMLD